MQKKIIPCTMASHKCRRNIHHTRIQARACHTHTNSTFDKWYPSGTDIFRHSLPSLDEPPSITMVSVSAEDLLLSRLNDFDFGAGGWTPFNSNVESSLLFRSKNLITLLFVSATNNLPEVQKQCHT